jgi:hypothetical protein
MIQLPVITAGAVGYSPARDKSHFQGMDLRFLEWQISPLKISKAFVRLYEDGSPSPRGVWSSTARG